MTLLKIAKNFINQDGKSVDYYQLYLVLPTGYKVAIKPCFANDKRLLTMMAESEVK